MHSTLRRHWRLVMPGLLAAAAMLALLACGNDDATGVDPTPGDTPSPGETASPTATSSPSPEPSPEPTPGTPSPTPGPTEEPGDPGDPGQQVRDLLLSSSLGLTDPAQHPGVDAVALELGADSGTWFAVSTGAGVSDILGGRGQVAGVFQRRTNGWLELDSQRLESTPTSTRAELISGASSGALSWIAVFGNIEGAGSTFELLRFDGSTLSSSLWWYSPAGEAARLIDLDGSGTPELVMDASDPSVLCPGCGVIDYQEVIYYWVDGGLRSVEFAPLERGGEVADVVAEGIAQVRAGLWRDAASTLSAASAMAPRDSDIRWMAILSERIADGRLRQAGASSQPLLTRVLAGEYETAVEHLRGRPPADVFSADGPLIAGTAAEQFPEVMGELLVEHATRALDYDAELAPAYAIRALGYILVDPGAREAAASDLRAAADIAPGIPFYAEAAGWLSGQGGGSTTEDGESDGGEPDAATTPAPGGTPADAPGD